MIRKKESLPDRMEILAMQSSLEKGCLFSGEFESLMHIPSLVRDKFPREGLACAISIASGILARKLVSRTRVGRCAGCKKEAVLKGVDDLVWDQELYPDKRDWYLDLAKKASGDVLLIEAVSILENAEALVEKGLPELAKLELKRAAPIFSMIPDEELAEKVDHFVEDLYDKIPRPCDAGRTEMIVIVDSSASMAPMKEGVIEGFNEMIARQRKLPGHMAVSLMLFNDKCTCLFKRLDVRDMPELSHYQYTANGPRAMLDAVGHSIDYMVNHLRRTPPAYHPAHILVAVILGDFENASRVFFDKRVREMVEREHRDYGWEFVFLGTNIDAVAVAGKIGIPAERAVSFLSDNRGMRQCFDAISRLAMNVRSGHLGETAWRENVDRDLRLRSKKKGN